METERNPFFILNIIKLNGDSQLATISVGFPKKGFIKTVSKNRMRTWNDHGKKIILKTDCQFNCNHFDHKFHLTVAVIKNHKQNALKAISKHISIFY